ncbi:MAG: hypothetical protein WBQ23_04715, partial [Bacteroidota bacterium]
LHVKGPWSASSTQGTVERQLHVKGPWSASSTQGTVERQLHALALKVAVLQSCTKTRRVERDLLQPRAKALGSERGATTPPRPERTEGTSHWYPQPREAVAYRHSMT